MSVDAVPAEVRLEAPHAVRQFRRAPAPVQKALRSGARRLARDPFLGTFIDLRRAPKAARQAWSRRLGPLANLYKLDLPQAWRALYTVASDDGVRVVLVLELLDHKSYDRLLGYATS